MRTSFSHHTAYFAKVLSAKTASDCFFELLQTISEPEFFLPYMVEQIDVSKKPILKALLLRKNHFRPFKEFGMFWNFFSKI